MIYIFTDSLLTSRQQQSKTFGCWGHHLSSTKLCWLLIVCEYKAGPEWSNMVTVIVMSHCYLCSVGHCVSSCMWKDDLHVLCRPWAEEWLTAVVTGVPLALYERVTFSEGGTVVTATLIVFVWLEGFYLRTYYSRLEKPWELVGARGLRAHILQRERLGGQYSQEVRSSPVLPTTALMQHFPTEDSHMHSWQHSDAEDISCSALTTNILFYLQ